MAGIDGNSLDFARAWNMSNAFSGGALNVCFYAPTVTTGGGEGDKLSSSVIFEILFPVRKA